MLMNFEIHTYETGVHNMKQENGGSKQTVYKVQALERALDILDSFSYRRRRMNLADVVSILGLKKTTAKRLLSNLTRRGYLKQDQQTKHYELGLRLFELGSVVHASFSIRKAALSNMRWLRDKTGLTVLMGQCQNDKLVYVEILDGTNDIKISSNVGEQRPLHYGMLGQVLMAFMPLEKVTQILAMDPLQAFTEKSITDLDAFWLRLAKIRENGCLTENGEAHQGITGFSAPIRDSSRKVVAALGAALPLPDYASDSQIRGYLNLVRKAAEAISSELGYLKV